MTLEELFANSQKNQAIQEVDEAPSQNFISKFFGSLRRPNLGSPGSFDRLKMQDLVPNIFGVTDPSVEGLLGPAQSKSLQSRSNIAGLLGAAAALSQGMSRGGPRRSALQNILGAAAGGYGAAGQQYQQGLQTVGQQQQLAQQMRERERAEMTRQAVERVIQSPEVASNPALVAYFRLNPDKALERQMQMQMAQQARQGTQPIAQQPAPQDSDQIGAATQAAQNLQGEKPLPEVPVTGLKSQYEKAITEAENAADFYSRAGGKENLDISKQYQSEADRYRGLLRQEGLLEGVESALSKVDPTLRARANALINNAPALTPEQLQAETRAILTDDANLKQEFDPRRIEQKLKLAKAGATTINMPSESERTAGFLTNRVVNSLNQLQRVVGANPTAASPNFGAEAVKFLTGSDYLKNLANPDTRQQVEAAQLEILDAALTLGTGAAYTKEQLENYRKSYFPELGNKPATIKDKQERLQSLLNSAMIKAGRAAPTMPSGVAPAFDMNAIEQELNRRKEK